MRTAIAILISLLAGSAFAQQDLKSYAPASRTDAPTFVNAEVVRVNGDNTATFRSESGEITLTADDSAPGVLGSLHAGDKVLVEYREVKGADGRMTRYVTSVTSASPTSGEPGRARVAPARFTPGSTVRACVLSYDKRRRRVTVIDESGGLRSLPLRSGASGLGWLAPGSNVAFDLGGTAAAPNVTRVTSLGTTPVFAAGNAFPAVSGRFVELDRATGLLTLDTATAGRVTFPLASGLADTLGGVRRGDDVSISFDVPTGVATIRATGAPTGPAGVVPTSLPESVPPAATIVAVQPASPPTVAATGGGATSPYSSAVPSLPAPRPVQGAVLPAAGATEPLSAGEVGTMQAQGERDLAAAAVTLAAAASGIDTAWAGFKDQCLRGATTTPTVTAGREWYLLADDRIPPPNDDACRAMHADLKGRAEAFLSQLETVQDAARKADVLPARVREVLDRHKLTR